jgi:hypothetical protein
MIETDSSRVFYWLSYVAIITSILARPVEGQDVFPVRCSVHCLRERYIHSNIFYTKDSISIPEKNRFFFLFMKKNRFIRAPASVLFLFVEIFCYTAMH